MVKYLIFSNILMITDEDFINYTIKNKYLS